MMTNFRTKNVVISGFAAVISLMVAQATMLLSLAPAEHSSVQIFLSVLFFVSSSMITFYVLRRLGDEESALRLQNNRAEKLTQRYRWEATHDSLTGLINRREFRSLVELACRGAREGHENHAVLLIGLDRFKMVNDHCGHRAGDTLLQQLPQVLQECLSDNDVLARISGDEFGVLLRHTDMADAKDIAEKLRCAVRDYDFNWGGRLYNLGASIGGAPITHDHCYQQEVLTSADTACYEAKNSGRNRVCMLDSYAQVLEERRGNIACAQELPSAIRDNMLELYAQEIQPISGDANGGHYELLVRLKTKSGKIRSPADFIPVAEQYGLAVDLDRWVVKNAFAWLASEQEKMPTCSPMSDACRCRIAINLSGQSITDPLFLDDIRHLIKVSSIDPRLVIFEITETAIIDNMAMARKFIDSLRKFGCKFALDDFGSGMAGFGYLKHLPVDYVKIDGSLVRQVAAQGLENAMVSAIVHLAKHMNAETIAEYVEDDLTRRTLETSGVDYLQGFLLHKPVPLKNISLCDLSPDASQQLVLVA